MTLFDYLEARSKRDESIDMLIARTQRSLSNWTLLIIAGSMVGIFLVPTVDSAVEKLLIFVLGAVVSNLAHQQGFWFGRPRGAGVPDPTLTETKTTETRTTETKTTPGTPTEPVPPPGV